MTPNLTPPARPVFSCYICKQASTGICVHCTRDACDMHLCERCRRCTDCCVCHLDQQPRR